MSMNEMIKSAKDRYEATLAGVGKLGTPEGNAATMGFLDGVRFGAQVEAAAVVAALDGLLGGLDDSLDDLETPTDVYKQISALRTAVADGSKE